ncbi:uncharacterized protein LOC105847589 [Hydra vulgaris]|uniref:uncharacterized protein LOC105847589 n=1 Tax=Hydra vulgaris TaxID=6087 RepID=UPI001F5E9E39|nr:uncharacterized protein LOC105847589 [Hydra vulgaris]
MSYSVVIFNIDNEVATVSSKWFKDSGCVLWPNCRVGKKLQNMLLNHEEPGAYWISYEVRVFSSNILTLKSARAKERLAEENSDLSSAEDGSRIIYAPSRFNSQEYCQPPSKISKLTSNSHTTSYLNNPLIPHAPSLVSNPSLIQTSASFSNDDHSIFNTQEFLRPLAKNRKFNSNCQTTSSNNYPSFPDKSALVPDFSISNSVQTPTPISTNVPCAYHCTHVVTWFEKLFKEIQQMRAEQTVINHRLDQQCQNEHQHVDSNFLNCLPLESEVDFERFGIEIDSDNGKRTSLIRYLRKRSDSNVNKTILNILRSLLKDNVLSCYSRDGKRGKKSFSSAKGNFVSIIQDVVLKVHIGVSLVQINVAISEQLKRLNQRNRNSKSTTAEETTPEIPEFN